MQKQNEKNQKNRTHTGKYARMKNIFFFFRIVSLSILVIFEPSHKTQQSPAPTSAHEDCLIHWVWNIEKSHRIFPMTQKEYAQCVPYSNVLFQLHFNFNCFDSLNSSHISRIDFCIHLNFSSFLFFLFFVFFVYSKKWRSWFGIYYLQLD